MDELIQRYANPGTSEGPLPSRLKSRTDTQTQAWTAAKKIPKRSSMPNV